MVSTVVGQFVFGGCDTLGKFANRHRESPEELSA